MNILTRGLFGYNFVQHWLREKPTGGAVVQDVMTYVDNCQSLPMDNLRVTFVRFLSRMDRRELCANIATPVS